MQLKYEFYTDTYGGVNISEADWKRLSQKAIQRLRQFAYDRLPDDWAKESYANQANCAVCEMAELIQADEKRSVKTSENTDGYSVSYDTGKTLSGMLYDVARVYFWNTGLLYAGVDPC